MKLAENRAKRSHAHGRRQPSVAVASRKVAFGVQLNWLTLRFKIIMRRAGAGGELSDHPMVGTTVHTNSAPFDTPFPHWFAAALSPVGMGSGLA